jgi:hypothetical protein
MRDIMAQKLLSSLPMFSPSFLFYFNSFPFNFVQEVTVFFLLYYAIIAVDCQSNTALFLEKTNKSCYTASRGKRRFHRHTMYTSREAQPVQTLGKKGPSP